METTKYIQVIKNSHRLHLSLINNERQNKRILSAKACGAYYLDTKDCYDGAFDYCYQRDLSACGGLNAVDKCKYIDKESCYGTHVTDYCEWDYNNGTNCVGSDYCEHVDD